MIRTRRGIQLFFLAVFLFLFAAATLPVRPEAGVDPGSVSVLKRIHLVLGAPEPDLFLRTSPLLFLGTGLASGFTFAPFLPALLVLGLTLLFGRFFCGFVCPLGTLIDISDRFLYRPERRGWDRPWLKNVKFWILGAVAVGAVLGVNLSGHLDPISLLTRSLTYSIHPYSIDLEDRLVSRLERADLVSDRTADTLRVSSASARRPTFANHPVALALLAAVLLPGLLYRRFFCRNLCPLGGLLGLLSFAAPVKRRVSGECTQCRVCEFDCKMGAIAGNGTTILQTECIQCLDCQSICPPDAISFAPFPTANFVWESQPVDLSRRSIALGFVTAVVAAPLLTQSVANARTVKDLLRPPGALPEPDFLTKCIRCGECMKVCETNTLQPLLFEAGLAAIGSPVLRPLIGPCAYGCKACSEVCPTGAIAEMTLPVKQHVVIGRAVFDQGSCIPWTEDRNCSVCEEMCPIPDKAIRLDWVDRTKPDGTTIKIGRPYVVPELCIGCGACEHFCPEGRHAVAITNLRERASTS